MIVASRVSNHNLITSSFADPSELVGWMGAVQAQEYRMAKWAVALRTAEPSKSGIEESLDKGEILRTHILQPTWHYVRNNDIRWMMDLCSTRLRSAVLSYDRSLSEEIYREVLNRLESILRDGNHLTRSEIILEMEKEGRAVPQRTVAHVLMIAEIDKIIVSGRDSCRGHTYALFEERVPSYEYPGKEWALEELAARYFKSHSPASLQDFVWWSGWLSITEARRAISILGTRLEVLNAGDSVFYFYPEHALSGPIPGHVVLLPPFDEYLISYKDRSAVIRPEHYDKAFNRYGTFYPVIVHNGRVIGNWKVRKGRSGPDISFDFFCRKPPRAMLELAVSAYMDFIKDNRF